MASVASRDGSAPGAGVRTPLRARRQTVLTVLTGLAAVAAMALLLAFGQVVRTGVSQAGARRAAAAIQADAAWRCQVALGQGLRTACQPADSAATDLASAALPEADAQMPTRVSLAR